MSDRIILHSDLNSFYASVAMLLEPSLRGKAVAVCGSAEDRHGIVLAKSEAAKRAGVKTGMVNWKAQRLCPGLIIVPPQFEQYMKYSKLTRAIYERFTDRVEPYGMDECWLDITGCRYVCGDGLTAAQTIRKTVKEELGLTVSVGVSFNKIFAKLGSDMKKPDAVTAITREDFREKIWPLPASDLLYVGRATGAKLSAYGIRTIGDIAAADPAFLRRLLGVNGLALWRYAAGQDDSRVMHKDYAAPIQSVGHGITCRADLTTPEEVWRVMLALSQDVGHDLRVHELSATGVQIHIRGSDLRNSQFQGKLPRPTQSPAIIAGKARELFEQRYSWPTPVRAVCVRAIDLVPKGGPEQLDLFTDTARLDRWDRLDSAVEEIRGRFGKRAVYPACLMGDLKMPGDGRSQNAIYRWPQIHSSAAPL